MHLHEDSKRYIGATICTLGDGDLHHHHVAGSAADVDHWAGEGAWQDISLSYNLEIMDAIFFLYNRM